MKISDVPLFTAAAIQERVQELATKIDRDYQDKSLTLIVVLNGALFFAADLARTLKTATLLDCVRAKSYTGTVAASEVALSETNVQFVAGRHVLVVEDIVDTGRTAETLLKHIAARQPASMALCTLMDKPANRRTTMKPEYTGFTIDNQFVVGYGLDYNGRYRHLPQVYVLE